MKNNKYSTNVFWAEGDNCFIATCPEFPLLSAHGETREEATSEFQIVLEMAIESYTEDNLELPSPRTSSNYSGQFRIRIPKSLHRDLAETAQKEGVSLNTYALSVLVENHSAKKVYTEKIQALERVIEKLMINMVSQNNALQVHTQKINFLETSSQRHKPVQSHWSTASDQVFQQFSTTNYLTKKA